MEIDIIVNLVAIFTFVNMVWTSIQLASWIKGKLQPPPPEQQHGFSGREALMLEELYNQSKQRESQLRSLEQSLLNLHGYIESIIRDGLSQ